MTLRPYLNAVQLAAVTPWTEKAIARLVERGVLVRGVHYFQLPGRRTRLIFKWTAIVSLIEGPAAVAAPPCAGRRDEPDDVDVTATETALERLLVRESRGAAPAALPAPRTGRTSRPGDRIARHARQPPP
jgi:hypothetical protein